MMMKSLFVLFAAFCFTGMSVLPLSYSFNDEASKIKFRVKNMGFTVKGNFSDLSGEVQFDAEDLSNSKVVASVNAATVSTGVKKRDTHLRSADFFEVETYPQITFRSTKFERDPEGQYLVTGDFKVKSTNKEIKVPFTFEQQDNGGVFKGTFRINRQDFGVGGDSMMMGDEVKILFELPVTKI